MNEQNKNRNRPTDTENKLRLPEGRRFGEGEHDKSYKLPVIKLISQGEVMYGTGNTSTISK